ncbi:MAG: hypothetical protein FJX72_08725 [Armatimonadetes bacterium]|nr:hypothetical protein [Armatimonadota bacterium]
MRDEECLEWRPLDLGYRECCACWPDNEPHCKDLTWGAAAEMLDAGCRPGVKYYRVPQQCGSRYVRRDEVPAALFEGREGQTKQWDDMGEAQVAYWCRVVDWLEAGNSSLYGELPDWTDA